MPVPANTPKDRMGGKTFSPLGQAVLERQNCESESSEGATEISPRRQPWVTSIKSNQAPMGRHFMCGRLQYGHPLAKHSLECSGRAQRRRSFQPRTEHRVPISLPKWCHAALATALNYLRVLRAFA